MYNCREISYLNRLLTLIPIIYFSSNVLQKQMQFTLKYGYALLDKTMYNTFKAKQTRNYAEL